MKALIYYGPKEIRIEERPTPTPGAKDIVVKVARAGICGTDMTAYLHGGESVFIFPPGTEGFDGQFGHEMVGTVYKVGAEVKNIKIGDRVFVNPMFARRDGMIRCDSSGAFSEYVLVEEAAYDYNLLKLPDDISFDDAVLIEPLSVGTHGKNCVAAKPGDKVVVYGAGTIGLCVLNALLASGISSPVVVDINASRLELVKELGGIPFNSKTDGDIQTFLKQQFGSVTNIFGEGCVDVDVFMDCAGAPTLLEEMMAMAKCDARISIVAVYKAPLNFNIAEFSRKRLILHGSTAYDMSDIKEAMENVRSRTARIRRLVTHHFSHAKAAEAFAVACDPDSGARKVVLDYD